MAADEQRCTDFVFQITDATAYRGLLNANGRCSSLEATMLGSGKHVAEMAQFERQDLVAPWTHGYDPEIDR